MVVKDSPIVVRDLEMEFHEHVREGFFSIGKSLDHIALRGVSFEVKQGDRLAIIGRNGSGKSTLLRCMAGFHRPKSGTVVTEGRVVLLAGTNPGFDSELTGRENIIEMALAYGIPPSEREGFSESVKEFTELGDDFERKFGNFSSGMQAKLGFGFISSIKSDILLVDETFGSGDIEFREKAKTRMNELLEDTGTVVMCTHSLSLAMAICNKAIVLENGYIVFEGEVNEGVEFYQSLNKKLVDWIDLPYNLKYIENDVVSFNFSEEFGVDEDIRFIIHDDKTKGYPVKDILPAGTDFVITRDLLPAHGQCKFKIQQKRLNRWYDASDYVQIVEKPEE